MLRVACVGGGPGGLYSAILLKLQDPGNVVTVWERNRQDDTFGFGVVFSDETLENLSAADSVSYEAIAHNWRKWSAIDVDFKGFTERSDGHAFAALERRALLQILGERAIALGVDINYQSAAPPLAELRVEYDLVIGADGVNSQVRTELAEQFASQIEPRPFKYAWFGTDRPNDCFKFVFVDTPHGMFWAHIYPYSDKMSTFLVETDPETWARAGLDKLAARPFANGESDQASMERCEQIFAGYLDGHRLQGNVSRWLSFRDLTNQHWHDGNVVIIGDAAHTAHFSIGSGTKQALEDAIALVGAIDRNTASGETDVTTALRAYESERRPVAASLRRSAMTSLRWFESIKRYEKLPAEQFVFQLLTRSQRLTRDNLALRDPDYVSRVDRWYSRNEARRGNKAAPGTPPMFYPFKLKGLELRNRIVVSPMAQYSAVDGVPGDWHLVHLGARAVGGAGLVMTEMTCVSPEGRITPGCTGVWNDVQQAAWTRIVNFVHQNTEAKIGLQLGHAGRRGSVRVLWEGDDLPLAEGAWEPVGPSPIPYLASNAVPHELDPDELAAIVQQHAEATARGAAAGFDLLELHFAHGYLVSSFLTPLSNKREDRYGGPLTNRARLAIEVLDAAREAWPAQRPISVRISATDWVKGGFDAEDSVALARMLRDHGADLIDVSTGQTSPDAEPEYGRLYQTPFSDRIRLEVGIPTIAIGAISSIDDVNTILTAGRADLTAIARPHLVDPYWTMNAALDVGYGEFSVNKQYLSGLAARRREQVP